MRELDQAISLGTTFTLVAGGFVASLLRSRRMSLKEMVQG
jgi:hypothetical protein